MSVEEHKAIARRLYEEVWNQGNLAAANELLAPTYVAHDPGTPGRPNGIEGEQQTASLYRSAFPDLHFTLEDVLAEGDEVAVRFTASSTHPQSVDGHGAHRKACDGDRHLDLPRRGREDYGALGHF